MSLNDVTGDSIRTKKITDKCRDNCDASHNYQPPLETHYDGRLGYEAKSFRA